jgi:hypothetical protein
MIFSKGKLQEKEKPPLYEMLHLLMVDYPCPLQWLYRAGFHFAASRTGLRLYMAERAVPLRRISARRIRSILRVLHRDSLHFHHWEAHFRPSQWDDNVSASPISTSLYELYNDDSFIK